MKSITLNLTNYECRGTADVSMWGGGRASIGMDKFNVSHLREIKDGINDGGFGVENINGAIVDIYRNFEGTLVFARTLTIGNVAEFVFDNHYELN